jgi:hypothetical protein
MFIAALPIIGRELERVSCSITIQKAGEPAVKAPKTP